MKISKRQLKRIIREEKAKVDRRRMNEMNEGMSTTEDQWLDLIELLQAFRSKEGLSPEVFADLVSDAMGSIDAGIKY
jgi:hypothetical protein